MTSPHPASPHRARLVRGLCRAAFYTCIAALTLLAVGCRHQVKTAQQAPPTVRPDWSTGYPPKHTTTTATTHSNTRPPTTPPPAAGAADLNGKPSLIETGMASWYGPQFNHKKSADGQDYDQNAMTAAHRTLPLGSLARVTNLTTNQTVVVRITDRGPFIQGRVMDLSEGAAKAIGLYRMGVARVKVEAYTPAKASPTGSWCVQTGAFQTAQDAADLRAALAKRYTTAKIEQFQGPTGYWVRIDPAGRDHAQAAAIQSWIGKPDDHADSFLVRLD